MSVGGIEKERRGLMANLNLGLVDRLLKRAIRTSPRFPTNAPIHQGMQAQPL